LDDEIVVERRRQWTPEEKAALMAEVEAEGPSDNLPSLAEIERRHVGRVLQATGWNKARAARVLEVDIKTLNTETGEVFETTIAPASEDEAAATVAVMGGDDWKRWIDQLADAGVLAPGFRTLNYTYIGSELTWPIYWQGTLGRAKVDLDRKAEAIRCKPTAFSAILERKKPWSRSTLI